MAALLNCSPAVFLIFMFSVLSSAQAMDMNTVSENLSKIQIQRGQKQISVFTVETATSEKAIQKGLAKSAPIPDNYGMLFILDKASEHFFWMKGMGFGLDILFFDKDRRLIEILPNLLPCEECKKYKTPANTTYAIEINAGMADALGIRTGDILVFAKK